MSYRVIRFHIFCPAPPCVCFYKPRYTRRLLYSLQKEENNSSCWQCCVQHAQRVYSFDKHIKRARECCNRSLLAEGTRAYLPFEIPCADCPRNWCIFDSSQKAIKNNIFAHHCQKKRKGTYDVNLLVLETRQTLHI